MTTLNFKLEIIEEIIESLKILSGKEAKLYIIAGGKAKDGSLAVTFVNTEDRSQHIFCKNADAPSDLSEGEDYLSIAVKTAGFLKILQIFEGFHADVAITYENGKYYVSTKGKAKTPLEVMEVTEEQKKSFIKPGEEKNRAKCSLSAEALGDLIRKGATSVDTDAKGSDDKGTENVCIHLNKEEISVSSVDGIKISFCSQKAKITYLEEGIDDVVVGIKYTCLKQLQTLLSAAKVIGITFGEKNLFVMTENKECLTIGLAQKVMTGETFLKKLIGEEPVGKLVFDSEEIIAGLKTVLALSEEKRAICISPKDEQAEIISGETHTNVNILSKEGDLSGKYYYSGKFLLMLCQSLDKGKIQIALKGNSKKPYLFAKNEKGTALSMLMPVNPPVMEEGKPEKADSAKNEA